MENTDTTQQPVDGVVEQTPPVVDTQTPEPQNVESNQSQPVETSAQPTSAMSEDFRKNSFVSRYKQLVDETGVDISSFPTFVRRDDGTYSIVLKSEVVTIR